MVSVFPRYTELLFPFKREKSGEPFLARNRAPKQCVDLVGAQINASTFCFSTLRVYAAVITEALTTTSEWSTLCIRDIKHFSYRLNSATVHAPGRWVPRDCLGFSVGDGCEGPAGEGRWRIMRSVTGALGRGRVPDIHLQLRKGSTSNSTAMARSRSVAHFVNAVGMMRSNHFKIISRFRRFVVYKVIVEFGSIVGGPNALPRICMQCLRSVRSAVDFRDSACICKRASLLAGFDQFGGHVARFAFQSSVIFV